MTKIRTETDSLGPVDVPAHRLWGAQTQRALDLFGFGDDPMPAELVAAYAVLKKACAKANLAKGRLDQTKYDLIAAACDEALAGEHDDEFPLPKWISGSGTQYNMNVNEVIANRCSQLAGEPLGSKTPVHPNDHVNMCQSTNDNFPSAMYMAAAMGVAKKLLPELIRLVDGFAAKADLWAEVVKIGRTHMQDATPLTLGQELSGHASVLRDHARRIEAALVDVYALPLGGTAVGTGVNAYPGFDADAVAHIADMTGLPFVPAQDKFAVQAAHDALVHLSACFKGLAGGLLRIASDVRLLSSGPRAGLGELILPANEPGSSIMPGKVNPTQIESLTMAAMQVMANDEAVSLGGAGGILQMNVYKPLIIANVMHSIRLLSGSMDNFRRHCLDGLDINRERITELMEQSLMLVTALNPVIGYEKAAKVAQHAHKGGLTLREAALDLGVVSGEEFDRAVVPEQMIRPKD